MKKFVMIMPLLPVAKEWFEAVGNEKLNFTRKTRFPLIQLINGYVEKGEKIRVIAVTCDCSYSQNMKQLLYEELTELKEKKGFLLPYGLESVEVPFSGDVAAQTEVFHKLISYFEDNDVLYGCMTYGMRAMPIAELMAFQYAYRVLKNVSIGCLAYGEAGMIYDITALAQLDEIVRMLADRKVANPEKVIDQILSL